MMDSMSDTAQLLSKLRNSFTSSSTFDPNAVSADSDVAVSNTPIVSDDVVPVSSSAQTPVMTTAAPKATPPSQGEALAVLDEVLQEVEQKAIASQLDQPAVEEKLTQEVPAQAPQIVAEPPVQMPPVAEEQVLQGEQMHTQDVQTTSPTPLAQPMTTPADTVLELDVSDGVTALAQAVPEAALQATNTLNPARPTSTAKESFDATRSNEVTPDSGTGLQYVEQEKTPEVPVEVESYLQKVEEQSEHLPEEIVIADGTTADQLSSKTPAQPVIVLPITPSVEKAGEKKNPTWSVRWLVEWSRRVMKMFVGKVVYREEEPAPSSAA